ncbi:MAG: formylglycine-generating enzyme family protein [bacterium]
MPIHLVKLTPFYIDSSEITQGEYKTIMGVNPSQGNIGDSFPVNSITWYDAALFCNARSERDGFEKVYNYTSIEGTAGNGCTKLNDLIIEFDKIGYRLPSEAEWEFACRGGSRADYFWGADTGLAGNYALFNDSNIIPVIQKLPNAWGLYDMAGNVWEWCNDFYENDYYQTCLDSGTVVNPRGPELGTSRVIRGGSWNDNVTELRSAGRNTCPLKWSASFVGFRCVLPAK